MTSADSLQCDGGCSLAWPALTWTGSEAALAYYSGPTVMLQRLTGQGQRTGAPIVVGDAQSYQLALGVATDGAVYVVCWTTNELVDCASVSIATGQVTPGFDSGSYALGGSVAYGPGGFAVAFGFSSAYVQPLNPDASQRGDPISVASSDVDTPTILATPTGYVVGLSGWAQVYSLSATFDVLGSVQLRDASGLYGLGASGAAIGVDWFETATDLVQGAVQPSAGAPVGFGIGADAGCPSRDTQVSAAGAASSFAFTWRGADGLLHYRGYDDQGAPLGPEAAGPSVGADCLTFPYPGPLASVAVGDGFLVADQDAVGIGITHIACP
jgi:hypothetical protein